MKIIFCDIDGVLNSAESFKRRNKMVVEKLIYDNQVDWPTEPMLSNLNNIIKATDAKIVISSTWRFLHQLADLRGIFNRQGLKGEIIDKTPIIHMSMCRGKEIDKWLKDCGKNIESFVILDDDRDMEPHMDKLVHTTWKKGLTEEHANKATEILNMPW